MSAAGLLATDADRAALAEVLASPEFQAGRWRGEALRLWLVEWWERLTELLGTAEAGQWAGLARTVFLVAALVALLLLWRAARARAAAGTPARREPTAIASAPPGPDVETALTAARRALSAGQAAEAVRHAFLAATRAVAGRLRSTAVDVLTGRELMALVADEGFGRLAGLHERTVFGRHQATADEAVTALQVAARLASGAGLPPAVASSPTPQRRRAR